MQVFQRQIKTAHKLIAKFGQNVNLVKIKETEDSDNPYLMATHEIEKHVVKMCFLPTRREDFKTLSFDKDSENYQGAVLAYFTSQTIRPVLKDYIERDGKTLRILSIDEINPNGESCLYKLILKE